MGRFEGISTRTPATSSSRTPPPYLAPPGGATGPSSPSAPPRDAGGSAVEGGGDERGMQAHAERGHLAGRLLGAARGLRSALATQRGGDLLGEVRLTVGRGSEGPEMAGPEAEPREARRP